MGFEQFINLFKPGEPVDASVGNRPIQQLAGNIIYLLNRMNAADLGSALFARQKIAEPSVVVGTPVWFNPTTNRFEKAIASATHENGTFYPSNSSRVWGIISYKHTPTIVDILILGFAKLNIAPALEGGGPVTPGLYYLSADAAGQLTKKTPYGWPPLLAADGNGHVLLCPHWLMKVGEHVHHHVSLVCKPAGNLIPPTPGGKHAIHFPDPTRQGWLPASHAIFNGKAPPNAAFGYNINAHEELKNLWPLWNPESVYLDWNRGKDPDVGATAVPLGPGGLCIVNRDGIWWLSDCYDDVPWPTSWPIAGDSESETDQMECPRFLHMSLDMYWTQPQFGDDKSVVTSLRSLSDQITVRCAGGVPGSRGDLELLFNLPLLVENNNAPGSLVMKNLTDSKIQRGRVVEGVYTVSQNVSLTSDLTPVRLIEGDDTSPMMYQGRVGINFVDTSSRTLPITLVRSADSGATEETYHNIMFLGLRAGPPVSYRGRLSVPASTGFVTPRLRLQFLILGRVPGTLPALQLTARRIPRPPNGLVTPVNLPLTPSEFVVNLNTVATLSSSYQYIEATSDPFDVVNGEIIFFTLRRPGGDAYAGEVGILDHKGILSED